MKRLRIIARDESREYIGCATPVRRSRLLRWYVSCPAAAKSALIHAGTTAIDEVLE